MPTRTTDRLVRLTTPGELRRWSLRCHAAGMTVGLVPTMGALHEGHLSLVRRALAECDRVAISIFVNPKQFGPREDFSRYPRPLDQDLELVRAAGAHAAFVPTVESMYPEPQVVSLRLTGAAERLEGEHRPGHFEGVALVVAKLFVASRADRAYFGHKDAQQSVIVQEVAAALDTGVSVVVCPVVRDPDGLALSSRNVYLTPDDRRRALAIPRGLRAAADAFARGERSAATLERCVRDELDAAGADIDYVAVADPASFGAVSQAGPGTEILVAARIGGTRLIDAMRLGIDDVPVVSTPR
jgi:pantoate--beta-alanine ligase